MMKELAGTTIVITGASSGIGAATAVACGAAGMNVVLGGRRLDRLEQVSRRVEAVGGATAIVVGDVRDRSNVDGRSCFLAISAACNRAVGGKTRDIVGIN